MDKETFPLEVTLKQKDEQDQLYEGWRKNGLSRRKYKAKSFGHSRNEKKSSVIRAQWERPAVELNEEDKYLRYNGKPCEGLLPEGDKSS